jgi:hypothetical protein
LRIEKQLRLLALPLQRSQRNLQCMNDRNLRFQPTSVLLGFILVASTPALAQPSSAAISAFDSYAASVESRLPQQHRSTDTFLIRQADARLRHGDLIVEQLTPTNADLPGALLHHWRGTAFAQGATAADFERLMRDFAAYPQHFSPQVLRAAIVTQHDDHLQASMRVRQRHIITVVMDTFYDITFVRLDPGRAYSISRSTRITEIESPGTSAERALAPSEEHGFLWRQNTYWTYEQRDGGLYLQVESVSLSRSIPRGLAWAIRPFVESVPRESLEFTLRSTCNALRK